MSSERTVRDVVLDAVAAQASKNRNEIDAAATLDSLGLDSLDRVELVMKIEEDLGVELSDEKIDQICSVQELIEYVESLKK